ncbi:hypothetical protein GTY23_41450, partial [Streptomyces sp. SID5998]|nr:hypothetical protein [Streptomyces sp. SID5998]
MPERLTFTLAGRDELSRVMNGTADSADRLRLRLSGINAGADGQLRDLRGRFLSADDAARRLTDSSHGTRDSLHNLGDAADKLGEKLKASLISLAPAAIPAASALGGAAMTLAAQFGAVALAAGAYGLALKPQIAAISEAVQAQTAYEDAVRTSGAASQEALKAQADYRQQLAALPPETRKAAVAVGLLKDSYEAWSDSLSGDVMGPFTKGVAVANALLPKTTGLVKGASGQFDRLITMVGGAIETPGFDKLNTRVTDFADRTLDNAVDKLTVFLTKADAGEVGDGLNEFLDYARANGPAVWETLENVGDALINVLKAGSDVGVGMLDVINALSGIVSAVPPEAIGTLLQLAIAIKAVNLAAAGGGAAKAAMLALGTQIVAMRTAAAGSTGVISGMGAAIGGLSREAKLAMAGTGIGLLLVGLSMISERSRQAPPDVGKLTDSLKILAETGKVSGEAARAFGTDLGDLYDKVRSLTDPSTADKVQQFLVGWTGWDSTPVKDAKDNISSIDEALAGLVKGGQADLAAAALKRLTAEYAKGGHDVGDLTGHLDAYHDALAGQALEQRLAADSMGLFGQQAADVQAKLDEQKKSADGLRQAITALNDVQRQGLSSMIDFEAAIDASAKAARANAGVLSMQGGQLTLTTEKQRAAAQALNDLAAKTDEAAASARESGTGWSEVNGIYERGRQQLIANAQQMGLNEKQAKALADQILKTPDKTAKLRGDLEDLQAKLADAKARLKSVPDSRKAKVRADIANLQYEINRAKLALGQLHDRTVYINAHMYVTGSSQARAAVSTSGSGRIFERAYGGPVPGYAAGGDVQFFPDGGFITGPGGPRSDAILALLPSGAIARVSNTEYVVQSPAVSKYGVRFLDALNRGLLDPALVKVAGYANGGLASGGITYSPASPVRGVSDVASAYSSAHQPITKDEYDKQLRARANAVDSLRTAEARLEQVRSHRHTHAQLVSAENAVAKARRTLATATASAQKAEVQYRQQFSLSDWGKTLSSTVKANAAYEKNLAKIASRGGSDVIDQLRGMGAEGAAMVAALAKASKSQFTQIVADLRKLAPTASATLADFTKQLSASTSGSKAFQANLLKLAAAGYGDLATQLAGQGDADAMALAAAAVKSPAAAKKAEAAVKASQALLTSDQLAAATLLLSTLAKKKNATVADVVAAGVSWPTLVSLAPAYAKQIKAIPGSGTFIADMKARGVALAQGGLLLGPGTSTSDSIPLWGSTGEYMVKAAAVAKYGVKFMDAVNTGRLPVGRAARPG